MSMRIPSCAALLAVTLVAALGSVGCGEDRTPTMVTVHDTVRIMTTDTIRLGSDHVFHQIERLGNPLVSEALLPKRSHPLHNAIGPDQDVALVRPYVLDFVRNVAGRDEATANTIAAVLTPDMLIVQTQKDPASAGWLSWALADGYGGRKLTDDVSDIALGAVFGPVLSSENVSPGLATDNVAQTAPLPTNTFPYVAPPNQ